MRGAGFLRHRDGSLFRISPIASEKSVGKNPTPSDKFVTPAPKERAYLNTW